MKVTDILPELRKRPLVRCVYWLCTKIEEYADYRSPCPPDSLRYKALTKMWQALLEMSLRLYRLRRSQHGKVQGA